MAANFVGKVFIGSSLDGFIARENGDLEWLTGTDLEMSETGYDEFFASVDAMVIGRNTYDTIAAFEEWPYGGKRVLVLSRTLTSVEGPQTSVHHDVDDAVATLEAEGVKAVYVDGGKTIQEFLRRGLIGEITISRAPVLIGSGIPLFGPLDADVHLALKHTKDLGAGFVQSTYEVVGTGTGTA
ncbi:MAG TPA: dihydrofolate reductase family protein [Glaciibacter sp.]|nr:dihydrofolate reductase family protein [Glaciibacter sp.]